MPCPGWRARLEEDRLTAFWFVLRLLRPGKDITAHSTSFEEGRLHPQQGKLCVVLVFTLSARIIAY